MIGIIIQARMASTRLPGKVLLPVAGKPMLQFLIERLQKCKLVEKIIVATSTNPENKKIIDLCSSMNIPVFAGSEDDVLDRFYRAAKKFNLDAIVRITSDCPLMDPLIVDMVVEKFLKSGADYLNNIDPPTFPDGMDVEVFSFAALERAWTKAIAPHHREHVTAFIRETQDFTKASVQSGFNLSNIRLTVDTTEDYELVCSLVPLLPPDFHLQNIIDALAIHDELLVLNKHFVRDEKYIKQVKEWKQKGSEQTEEKSIGGSTMAQNRNISKSVELLNRAKECIPGKAQTMSKSPEQFIQGVHPFAIDRANGCRVWDVDGNEYLDLTCALGPITLGFNHPEVISAVKSQLDKGNVFPLPNALEVELAEVLKKIVPCAEMVRYGLNGSDATTAAIRLARAHTSRDHIAKCGYHGWQDWSICTNEGRNKGVPQAVKDLTHEFKYNDSQSLKDIFVQYPGKIAAVILEPIAITEPKNNFLQQVKDLAHENGAILIFDEIVTGFRLALGGAQEYFGVVPDVACMGKGVANGMALSIVAGKKEVMQSFKDVFFSFTYGGEAISLAAALATIKVMQREPIIAHIWRVGKIFQEEYSALANKYKIPSVCTGLPPHAVCTFKDSAGNDDLLLKSLFLQETIKHGVLTNASLMWSYAHKENDVKEALAAVESAFIVMRKALDEGNLRKYLEGPPVQPRARPQG